MELNHSEIDKFRQRSTGWPSSICFRFAILVSMDKSTSRQEWIETIKNYVLFAADGSTAGLSIPLQPKEVTVQATISITYEIVHPAS